MAVKSFDPPIDEKMSPWYIYRGMFKRVLIKNISVSNLFLGLICFSSVSRVLPEGKTKACLDICLTIFL